MIDGIKATYIAKAGSHLPALPCWDVLVNESTGKRVNDTRIAELRGLSLALKPTAPGGYAFNLAGSLHKYHNCGTDNATAYTMADLQNTVSGFAHAFGIDPHAATLHGLEIGLNIPLPYPVIRLLKNVVSFGSKAFQTIDKRLLRNGLCVTLDRYSVKAYDKAKQTGKKDCGDLLRFEVSVNKMPALAEYGISSLADLQDPAKVYPLKAVLLKAAKAIIWTDTTANLNRLSDREQKQWLYYSNARSWESMNRDARCYHSKKWHQLLNSIGNPPNLSKLISDTWDTLFEAEILTHLHRPGCKNEADSLQRLHRPTAKSEADKIPTFALLECTRQTLEPNHPKTPNPNATFYVKGKNNIKSAKNAPPPRKCATCGSDISRQRRQAKYCSETTHGKRGKACRNKGSNHRRDIKLKIHGAMNQNNFIAITYRANGSPETYTDTLHPSELSITREWLDKVERIDILPTARSEPPETLTGQSARDYLQTTISQQQKPIA